MIRKIFTLLQLTILLNSGSYAGGGMSHNNAVSFVVYSPDHRYMVSACPEDKDLKLWDMSTCTMRNVLDSVNIRYVVFSNDGKKLYCKNSDTSAKAKDFILSVETFTKIHEFKGGDVRNFYKDNDSLIVTVYLDKKQQVCKSEPDIEYERIGITSSSNPNVFAWHIDVPLKGGIWHPLYNSNTDLIYYSTLKGKTLSFFSTHLRDKEPVLIYADKDFESGTGNYVLSPDGKFILVTDIQALIDVDAKKVLWTSPENVRWNFAPVTLAFSEHGDKLLYTKFDGETRLCETSTGKLLVKSKLERPITAEKVFRADVDFAKNRIVYVIMKENTIHLSDISTGRNVPQ